MKKFLFLLLVLILTQKASFAGGPITVSTDGIPAKWNSTIFLHPEDGSCATFSNTQMVTKVGQNISHWENVTGAELDFNIVAGMISGNVDACNYLDYFVDSNTSSGLTDGINPVIFDNDGQIVVDIFGEGNRNTVLGFAGPDGFTSNFTVIQDGQAFFNCRCLAGNQNCGGILFTEDDLDFTMTHEIGHMIGLDHTQVNQDIADNTNCNLLVDGDCDDIPTMYPVSVDAGEQITPQRDDEIALLRLYGEDYLDDNTYTVVGALQDTDGDPLRCDDIQAETGDPADTIATVSGLYAPNQDINGDGYTDGSGECLSNCGRFTLRGLDPAKTYTITVKPIDLAWQGGSSISPCGTAQISGIVEELLTTIASNTQAAGSTVALGTRTTNSTGGVSSLVKASSLSSIEMLGYPVRFVVPEHSLQNSVKSLSANCASGSSSAGGCDLNPAQKSSPFVFSLFGLALVIWSIKRKSEANS